MNSAEVAVSVRGISKSFDSKVVLRQLSLELHEDEILAVLGPSGAGKSVLLKMIVGLERPDEGHIFLDGLDIPTLSERELYSVRSQIGYVFQDGALFDSLTVEENLEYPLRLHRNWPARKISELINERLAMLDMAGSGPLYPQELSGGMKKRVGLVRATMLNPKITLFDEPTAGLDPVNVGRFARTMQKFKYTRGTTGIFVTHDIPCALAVSDRIALLHEGRIHAIGTPQEMRDSQDPLVREFLFPEYKWHPGRPC